jgi:hypothetical protein
MRFSRGFWLLSLPALAGMAQAETSLASDETASSGCAQILSRV